MGTAFEIFFLCAAVIGATALVVHLLRRRGQLAVLGAAVRAQDAQYPGDPASPVARRTGTVPSPGVHGGFGLRQQ